MAPYRLPYCTEKLHVDTAMLGRSIRNVVARCPEAGGGGTYAFQIGVV